LSSGEKKTILNLLSLYLLSTFLIVTAFSYSYYVTQKEQYIQNRKNQLFDDATNIFNQLQTKHNQLLTTIEYPKYGAYNSAIYDNKQNLIFSTFQEESIDFTKNYYYKHGYEYYIFKTSQYYLGAAFIVIKQKSNPILNTIVQQMVPILIMITLIILFTSIFLVKLILKPIRNNLKLLDQFIKDTTHELNTPVSTILTNIELIQAKELDYKKLVSKINRIKSASLTISNLYEDLVYLTLHHKVVVKNENININNIINERVEYFSALFRSKGIEISISNQNRSNLFIDKNQIQRLIDNLLSNAIKYSPKNSKIEIKVDHNNFQVCDQGEGMTQKQIQQITDRYTRFNNTQGGFGIGFNIIYNISKEYNLNIKIKSQPKEGTCVIISW
jgi:two-component system OmpR family sensor kinase